MPLSKTILAIGLGVSLAAPLARAETPQPDSADPVLQAIIDEALAHNPEEFLWAEWVRDEVVAEVAHRHVVLTIPRLPRPLFRRRRELLKELARSGAEAVQELRAQMADRRHRERAAGVGHLRSSPARAP
jgi:hypothetical protein